MNDFREFPDPHRFDKIADSLLRPQMVPRDLAIDGQFTFRVTDILDVLQPENLAFADIAVVIDYEIPLIHWKRTKVLPLHTRRQDDGTIYWQLG